MQACSREAHRNIIRAIGVIFDDCGSQGHGAIGHARGGRLEPVAAGGEGSARLVARLQEKAQLDAAFGAELQAAVAGEGGRSLPAALAFQG